MKWNEVKWNESTSIKVSKGSKGKNEMKWNEVKKERDYLKNKES